MRTIPAQDNPTSSIGFLIGMGAWSITFLTLIWGYLFYRIRMGIWLEDYIGPSAVSVAVVNTAVLILSSWLLHRFQKAQNLKTIGLGLFLGAFFLKLQWGLWEYLMQQGVTLNSSVAGSFFYLLTGFHALHILIGILILAVLGGFTLKNNDQNILRFNFALRFWDLLLVFWVVLFVLIFIIK